MSVYELITTNPSTFLLPVSFGLSFLSLSLTPSFISLISLLTFLLLYTEAQTLGTKRFRKIALLWLTLTVSISLSHLQPSIHALSTPLMSIVSLALLSGISSFVALVPIVGRNFIKLDNSPLRILVFPTLWTTVWLVISWISPLGRLITWTPLSGVEHYQWTRVAVGLSGTDWIVASWASIGCEILKNTIFRREEESVLLLDIDQTTDDKTPSRISSHSAYLSGFLLVLTIPSFFISPLPLPPLSYNTTPLRVACILPEPSKESQLERFMKETKSHMKDARIFLWPESAVLFETKAEKDNALETIQMNISHASKVWVGVSFEERISETETARDGLHRNGLALVGPDEVEIVYYKRKLVPIAESFSQITSQEEPIVHTINYPRPNHPPAHWGPERTRPIPLSFSICLDFSAPLTSLSSRPALILAPAKTWHVGVGRAMYELARARGEEIGADVLWCDGGAGGLSGVAGDVQVGAGSWVKQIGVPYPNNKQRTVYGFTGDWLPLALMFVTAGFTFLIQGDTFKEGSARIAIGQIFTQGRQRIVELISRVRGSGTRSSGGDAQLIDTS